MALGTTAEIEALVGPDTEVVELAGRFAMPGFVESHGHFTGLGNSLMILDLSTAANWDEIVAMVADAVTEAEPGEVIRGRGWHQEKWNVVPEPNVDGGSRSTPRSRRCLQTTRWCWAMPPGTRRL